MFLPSAWLMPVCPPRTSPPARARGGHLHERHAALVDGGGETREVAHDAAAQRDQDRRAFRCESRMRRVNTPEQRPPVLVGLAVRDQGSVFIADTRGREARPNRRQPMGRHAGVADHDGTAATGAATAAPDAVELRPRPCGWGGATGQCYIERPDQWGTFVAMGVRFEKRARTASLHRDRTRSRDRQLHDRGHRVGCKG